MAEKKKLTDKQMEAIAMQNHAIQYLTQEVRGIKRRQSARTKATRKAKKAKKAASKRQLRGLANFYGMQGFLNKNPMDK
tara:strand:+ start:587 stop:823 length:237 start_codon:yes stop_codon:yes gene_type:complete